MVLRLSGKFDVSDAQRLVCKLFPELDGSPDDVLLDLSEMRRLPSWILAFVCALERKVSQKDKFLGIVQPSKVSRRELDCFTPTRKKWAFYATLQAALKDSPAKAS